MKLSIELFSKYRSQIMGLATLWVMTSHVRIPTNCGKIVNFFEYVGFGGVEMFMIVSGFGLFFAMKKSSSLRNYYFRRFVRIIPIWTISIVLLYFFCNSYSLFSFDFVRRVGQCWWFVPFIIAVYVISPFLYKSLVAESRLYVIFIICVILLLQLAYKLSGISNITVTLSFARVFDFLIGMWFAKMMTENKKLNVMVIVVAGLIGLIIVYLCSQHIILQEFWDVHKDLRLYIMILTGPMMCFVAILFSMSSTNLSIILSWIGKMSFEVYLCHVLIWWIIRDDNLLPWYIFYPLSLSASYLMYLVNQQLSKKMLCFDKI